MKLIYVSLLFGNFLILMFFRGSHEQKGISKGVILKLHNFHCRQCMCQMLSSLLSKNTKKTNFFITVSKFQAEWTQRNNFFPMMALKFNENIAFTVCLVRVSSPSLASHKCAVFEISSLMLLLLDVCHVIPTRGRFSLPPAPGKAPTGLPGKQFPGNIG